MLIGNLLIIISNNSSTCQNLLKILLLKQSEYLIEVQKYSFPRILKDIRMNNKQYGLDKLHKDRPANKNRRCWQFIGMCVSIKKNSCVPYCYKFKSNLLLEFSLSISSFPPSRVHSYGSNFLFQKLYPKIHSTRTRSIRHCRMN